MRHSMCCERDRLGERLGWWSNRWWGVRDFRQKIETRPIRYGCVDLFFWFRLLAFRLYLEVFGQKCYESMAVTRACRLDIVHPPRGRAMRRFGPRTLSLSAGLDDFPI